MYFECGASNEILPEKIDSKAEITFCARKTNLSVFVTGVVGVIGYRIEEGLTLAVYFRVPYNKMKRPNKWNVMLVEDEEKNFQVNKETYEKLQRSDNNPIDGNMCWVTNRKVKVIKGKGTLYDVQESDKYRFSGSMSSSGKGVLEVHITEDTEDAVISEEDCSKKST